MDIFVKGVSFGYSKDNFVLKDLNLKLMAGSFTAVVGPNGSGKTTLLQLLAGLYKPTKGKISYSLPSFSALNKIGFAFQFPEEQFFLNTVFEELAFTFKNKGLVKKDSKLVEEISSFLKSLDIDISLLKKSPFSLSLGDMRLISFANVLVGNKVIILDEPTVSLDGKNKKNVIKLLLKLHEKYKITVIFSAHRLDEAISFAKECLILKDGRIIFKGSVKDIFLKKHPEIFDFLPKPKILGLKEKLALKFPVDLANAFTLEDIVANLVSFQRRSN